MRCCWALSLSLSLPPRSKRLRRNIIVQQQQQQQRVIYITNQIPLPSFGWNDLPTCPGPPGRRAATSPIFSRVTDKLVYLTFSQIAYHLHVYLIYKNSGEEKTASGREGSMTYVRNLLFGDGIGPRTRSTFLLGKCTHNTRLS